MDLPKFDEGGAGGGVTGGGGQQSIGGGGSGPGGHIGQGGGKGGRQAGAKLDDYLPKQEHRMLNPNVHIYSEELAKALEEKYARQ